jgi:hypothetical protein
MFGTASTVSNWLLVEQPGPWGSQAPVESRMPQEVADRLRSRVRSLGIRVILLRRPGGGGTGGVTSFAAHSGPGRPWIRRVHLQNPAELLDLELEPLGDGAEVSFGAPDREPLFLVCTNGRRDPCCAERGRPLATALAVEPDLADRVWECSHIGGDRFAANLVCFPHAAYFGRVSPQDGAGVARGYAGGLLDLEHYRGRSSYPFDVQAAEHLLRLGRGIRAVEGLDATDRSELPDGTVAIRFLDRSGGTYECRLRARADHRPRPLTCHARTPAAPPVYELVSLRGSDDEGADPL